MSQFITERAWPYLWGKKGEKDISFLNMLGQSAARALSRLWSDTFLTNAGIDAGNSSGYTYQGATNYNVIRTVAASVKESDTNITGDASVGSGSYDALGQTLIPAASYRAETVIFRLAKVGLPTGNIVAKLYNADAGGLPTGAAIATSGTLDVSTLAAAAEKTFTWGTPVVLTAGQKYAVTLEASGANNWDGTKYITVSYDNTNVYAAADAIRIAPGSGVWSALAGVDLYFKMNGSAASAIVQSVRALNLPSDITQAIVFLDSTPGNGTVTAYISTNDGATWSAALTFTEGMTDIIIVPAGKQIKLKVIITENASLDAWGVAA